MTAGRHFPLFWQDRCLSMGYYLVTIKVYGTSHMTRTIELAINWLQVANVKVGRYEAIPNYKIILICFCNIVRDIDAIRYWTLIFFKKVGIARYIGMVNKFYFTKTAVVRSGQRFMVSIILNFISKLFSRYSILKFGSDQDNLKTV